jgi:hypothetical protein
MTIAGEVCATRLFRLRYRSCARKAHGEGGAGSRPGARSAYLAAVQFDEVLDDREPEPESAVLSRCRCVGLAKAVEYMRYELRFDTLAKIANRDIYAVTRSVPLDDYLPARVGKAHGIRE